MGVGGTRCLLIKGSNFSAPKSRLKDPNPAKTTELLKCKRWKSCYCFQGVVLPERLQSRQIMACDCSNLKTIPSPQMPTESAISCPFLRRSLFPVLLLMREQDSGLRILPEAEPRNPSIVRASSTWSSVYCGLVLLEVVPFLNRFFF